MRKKQKTRKWGKLAWTGLGVLVASPVLGTVSFALVASLVGEKKLEDASGQMTALGSLSMWLPAVVGAGLIVIDLVFKPTIKSAWQAVVAIALP